MQELITTLRNLEEKYDEAKMAVVNCESNDRDVIAEAIMNEVIAEAAFNEALNTFIEKVETTLASDDYQKQALTTITYNDKFTESERVMYAALGLVNEAGEVAGKIKKYYRDSIDKGVMEELIAQELGDVLWYIAVLAQEFDLSLEKVMQMNLDKLKSRQERGVLQGDGDSR